MASTTDILKQLQEHAKGYVAGSSTDPTAFKYMSDELKPLYEKVGEKGIKALTDDELTNFRTMSLESPYTEFFIGSYEEVINKEEFLRDLQPKY